MRKSTPIASWSRPTVAKSSLRVPCGPGSSARRPSALPGRRQASPKSKIASPLVHKRMHSETDNQHSTEKQTEPLITLRVITPSRNGGVRSVLPVNPFGFLQREIDRMFENFTGGSEAAGQAQVTLVPSMDVIETETEILIAAEMPGLQRDDVQITIADDVLTIRGEKRPERKEEGDKDKRYQVSERSYGVFLRSLQLPAGVDPSSVEATMSNGVLRIRIPTGV